MPGFSLWEEENQVMRTHQWKKENQRIRPQQVKESTNIDKCCSQIDNIVSERTVPNLARSLHTANKCIDKCREQEIGGPRITGVICEASYYGE